MTLLGTNVSTTTILIGVACLVALLLLVFASTLLKRRSRKLDRPYFTSRWHETQALCAKPDTWPLAVINADKLLEEALRKSKFKGKTMGERLVSAQHTISENDLVWFGHKLRNKLVHEDYTKLKKKDVVQALLGFRNALKDLGALE